MTKMFIVCTLLVSAACSNNDKTNNEAQLLNQRILRLEQKIDSLISDMHTNSIVSNNKSGDSSLSSSTSLLTNRCQAITKKGTQCKRKVKNYGYCWQHEG